MVGLVPASQRGRLSRAAAVLALALMAIGGASTPGSGAEGRFVDDHVTVAGRRHALRVWLPPSHAKNEPGHGIVFLHGSLESGRVPALPTRVGLGPRLAASPDAWPFVVAFPQKPEVEEEWVEHEPLVLAVRERLIEAHGVDPRRVALSGISQGGHGVWFIGARHPGRWSCLVPVCGYGRGRSLGRRAAPLPVWAFHGLRDDVVDPRETRELVRWARERRAELGLDPEGIRMTLYPEANHGSWDAAYAEPDLPGWILAAEAPEPPVAPKAAAPAGR